MNKKDNDEASFNYLFFANVNNYLNIEIHFLHFPMQL